MVHAQFTGYLLCNFIDISGQHDCLFDAMFLKICDCLF